MAKVLVLRTCDKRLRSFNNFKWPAKGPISAPDWNREPVCGNGLHGLLWGEGDHTLLNFDDDARWLVVEVEANHIVHIGRKVKFPKGVVVFCGNRARATKYLLTHGGHGRAVVGAAVTVGSYETAVVGGGGSATAGRGGVAVSGDDGVSLAGTNGKAVAGNYGKATAGDRGCATADERGHATVGILGHATVGIRGHAVAGNNGIATAGAEGTAKAGDRGHAVACMRGVAIAGRQGVAFVYDGGSASAGVGGTISFARYADASCRRRDVFTAAVKPKGHPRPNVLYKLVKGVLVPA